MKVFLVVIVERAYNPQSAAAKQKCLTHLERDLEALKLSRFDGNRLLAGAVGEILATARTRYREYHAGQLSREAMAAEPLVLEARLQDILTNAPVKGWPADAQRLANRIQRHWTEWLTFLDEPEVKPDNNDAERALRPVVVHRKVTAGARSDWGAQLVAQMFSFLETVRLQGGAAISQLYELLSVFWSQSSRYTIQLNFSLTEIESTSFPQTSFLFVATFSGIPPTTGLRSYR